ncbi:toxin glutamine deamidase domain-containing protein [Streptomyces sp. DG2A-72]|uniref:toxin glutamine deamidase domain-containing protein n=1 Tax=Streptomyces sp. DG2A-72 TaxID=3051386 RepID=UPI00265C6E66|nr:toxin glutamine deamidase domain-containing protein [Streptomyces sp. DG2A-72]MDO0937047.1 toxin glutamine deamidase domain-containing protein [Streptomyces sp. DG2A-72]
MMLPDELEWVLQMLGFNWPTADEDKLRDSAALWRKFGDDVTGLHTSANSSARMVTAHNAGESIDKFSKTYKKFDGGDGSDGYLANAAQAAHIIANVMEACAYLVEFAKWAVIAQLIALAIQIAAAAAAAPFTFGLSSVAGMGATQAARLIVRRLLDELKQALLEAIVEAMKEPAISAIEAIISDLIRQTVNVGFGAQQGYDLAHTMKTGGTAGLEALKQSPQTLAEGVRDSLGKRAGDRVHHAVDSRIDGYGGPSGAPGSNGDGGDGGSGGRGGDGSGDSGFGNSGSGSSDSGSSNSSSDSGSSGSDSSGSTRTSTGSGPGVNIGGANIGGGISADAGGAGIGGPDVGSGPDSGSGSGSNAGSGSGQGPSSSDSPYSRPAPSLSGPSLSDFDDPSPGGASPSGQSTNSSPGTNGGPSVSGLSSPTPQSAPTPASTGGPSSSSGGGAIGTQIDSLATSVPTQSNAAPTPTTGDPSPAGSGGRTDGGSAVPTSPVAPSTAGGTAGSHHAGSTSGSTPSATSPTPNSGAARNPSASTPGTPSPTGTGPASTPNPTSPTTPRSTPTPTPDGRIPGTADGRNPGTADGRSPGTPDGRTPGQRTPGTPAGDGTPPRSGPGTTPGDRTPPRDSPGTTPGDRTPARNSPDPTGGTRTPAPGQNPSTTSTAGPNQTPAQSTPPRTASPSTSSTSTTTPSTPSGDTPGSSARPSPATSTSTPGTTGTPSTSSTPSTPGNQHQPGHGAAPTRPPQQPAGSPPPNAPNTPQQPAAQPQNTPPNPQHHQQQQVTAVPIHTVITTPSSSTPPSHATPATPQPPGSPQADPGTVKDQQHAQQDSLDDIRADLDHYPGGLSEPDPDDQQALADTVPHNEDGTPERFPDPFGPWTQLQNDGGNEVPGRSNNCADCSRSFLETWYGNPQVSAPRTLDTDEHGNPDPWSPEDNANDNQIRWTGAAHTYAGPGNDPDTANNIASVLQQAGPGSAAIVQVDWPGGGGHAFNAVNHNGNIIWIDTQSGEVSHDPLHLDNAAHVWHIPLDADRNPIDLTQPDAEDSESQSDESQNQQDDASQPEKSETSETSETSVNNGQPENDVSGDTAKQGDDTEAGATSRTQADPATPDVSNDAASAQPPTADPNTSPDPTKTTQDPTNDEPANENGRPGSESSKPTEPDSTPDGRKPSQDSPEGRQPSTHTTPDNTDNGTPPTPTATGTPSDPTTSRDAPQQTTTPSDPRTSIPHQQTTDPRTADPRTTDPRTSDPRTSDPHRDTPTQPKPETNGRPHGQDPNTPPRPDQTHPDHVDDPRSDTPDQHRSETPTPDPTRPDDLNQSPSDDRSDRSDRPSDMTKDSAVPTRESLPDGKNADAAGYVKDSVNGKKPLYGDIAAENPTQTSRPAHPERPSGPEDPAGGSPNATDPESRRQRDLAMLARANSKDPKDRDWFEKHYWPKSGYRRSRTAPAEDGRPVPQLHPTGDPNAPWMLANDTPDAEPEEYITEGSRSGERNTEISDENLKRLDEAAKARQQAIDADRQPHRDRKAAKDTYEANKTSENKQKFEEADAKHSPLHGKMTRASEDYGEAVAEFHAMPRHFPDHTRIDDRATGNNRFDQIWVDPNTDPPEFVVVEAKGSAQADLGDRRGIPPVGVAGETDTPQNVGQDQSGRNADGDQTAQDDPRPGAAKVRQGTRAYFETILHEMRSRSMRVLNDPKATAAQMQAAADEARLAQQLRTALEAGRVTYVLVKGHSDGERHNGYEMHQFDIRTQEEKDADNAQDPEA